MSSTYTALDLSLLAPPNIVEPLDHETIFQAMLADLRARDTTFDALVESDPAFKILEVCAYRELIIRQRVNDAGRGVMLAYATGTDLDHLGALFGVQRLTSTIFNSRLRVTGTTPAIASDLIQYGTDSLYNSPVYSSDGKQFPPLVGPWVACSLDGVWRIYFFEDGLEVGQITSALFYPGPGDPPLTPHGIDWSTGSATGIAAGVPATTVIEVDPTVIVENDTDFRRRIQLALEGFSVAGPTGAYIFHGLSANAAVRDISAISPTPGQVLISVLSHQGSGAASPGLLSEVDFHLNDDSIRPVTDEVVVQSAEILYFDVTAQIYTYPGPDAAKVLQEAKDALAVYLDSVHRLGSNVSLSGIYAALHRPGVQRVELTSPGADIVVDETQAAFCETSAVTLAGTDE